MSSKEEDALQFAVVQFLLLALPNDCIFHHSPNEGFRHVNFKMKLKKMGFKAGWPDLEIMHAGKTFLIELKKPGKWNGKRWIGRGQLTESQRKTFPELSRAGFVVAICHSIEEVQDALYGWGVIERKANVA